QVSSQVAQRRLECCLGDTHHVVVRKHAIAAEKCQCEDAAAAAFLEERNARAREANQRIRADVQGNSETLARSFDERIRQLGGLCESRAVHEEIKAAKFAIELFRER